MYYWIIQEIGGQLQAQGCFRTEQARDNRFDRLKGGEVHKFNSFSNDWDQVKQEFKDAQVEAL